MTLNEGIRQDTDAEMTEPCTRLCLKHEQQLAADSLAIQFLLLRTALAAHRSPPPNDAESFFASARESYFRQVDLSDEARQAFDDRVNAYSQSWEFYAKAIAQTDARLADQRAEESSRKKVLGIL